MELSDDGLNDRFRSSTGWSVYTCAPLCTSGYSRDSSVNLLLPSPPTAEYSLWSTEESLLSDSFEDSERVGSGKGGMKDSCTSLDTSGYSGSKVDLV